MVIIFSWREGSNVDPGDADNLTFSFNLDGGVSQSQSPSLAALSTNESENEV